MAVTTGFRTARELKDGETFVFPGGDHPLVMTLKMNPQRSMKEGPHGEVFFFLYGDITEPSGSRTDRIILGADDTVVVLGA